MTSAYNHRTKLSSERTVVASQVKPWGSHSDRWKRQKLREGLDPRKWDGWRRLAPGTRKDTSPEEYAKGKTIREQRRGPLESAAVDRALAWARATSRKPVNEMLIRKNMTRPSAKSLKRYANMTDAELRRYDARAQKLRKGPKGFYSAFWYHA